MLEPVGPTARRLVGDQVLAALQPAALELHLAAAEDVEKQRQSLHQNWEQKLERAGYEAEPAAKHTIVWLVVLVIAPLPHVPVHIAQTPRVWPVLRVTSHFRRSLFVIALLVRPIGKIAIAVRLRSVEFITEVERLLVPFPPRHAYSH